MKLYRVMAILLLVAGLASNIEAQIDTSGIGSWKMMYNSMADWEEGAFGANATGEDFDYGWGIYNTITHGLTGDSLFIIKLQDGTFRQLWIVEKSGSSEYKFRTADLDGENEVEALLAMNNYADKQFVYYNLRSNEVADIQPDADSWDLLLTKFTETSINYTVTGFLSNDGVTVSVFHAADSTTAADAVPSEAAEFTDSISAIGNSWYMLQGMSIVPLDTIAYFVKAKDGEIHKMQVTFFESGFSGLGRVGIRRQHFTGDTPGEWIFDTLVMGSLYADEEFYSMANGNQGRAPRNGWDIGFKSGLFTSSITANTTMGVELYTYPHGDTAAWYSTTFVNTAVKTDQRVRLYPVPATDELTVIFDLATQDPVYMRIFDITGKMVWQRQGISPFSGTERIQTGDLKPGIYMLRVGNRDYSAVRRFSVR